MFLANSLVNTLFTNKEKEKTTTPKNIYDEEK